MPAVAQLALFDAGSHEVAAPATAPALPTPTAAHLPQPSPRRRRAWLALHFGELSLAAAYHALPVERRALLDQRPWAVVEADRLKRIVACSPSAWRDGVRPGHSMNAAIALCAPLELIARADAAETELLKRIANHCLSYTSTLSVQPPNELLLEVRGSFRLFGGAAALLERVRTELALYNAGLQIALAPTARSAQWLARDATTPSLCPPRELAQRMGSLPVCALQWPLSVELQLARFGVTSIGDVLRLPRKDLARRIGSRAVHEIEQALGKAPWLHPTWHRPATYNDRVLLDFEVETTPLLEKLLERPLARLKRRLIGASLAINELHLTLRHRESDTRVVVRLQAPTADTAHISQLLHEHLDRLVLAAPIREVVLAAPRLLAARAVSQSLATDPTSRHAAACDPDAASRLLEQLQSRFGAQAVRSLALRPHHLPERAQHLTTPTTARDCATVPQNLPRRPLWLLSTPQPLDVEHRQGSFYLASSPETIEVETWDGPAVRRAYYRARTVEGAHWWVFRDLTSPQRWYLHGLFG